MAKDPYSTIPCPNLHNETEFEAVVNAVNLIVAVCHGQSFNAGWWDAARLSKVEGIDAGILSEMVPTKLMLSVSELAEAMEGHRKGSVDTHLPEYRMFPVELADAIIRIADLAGAHENPKLLAEFGAIFASKLRYNLTREDHKREARAAPGGKAY